MDEEVVRFSREFHRRWQAGEDFSAGKYFQENPEVGEDPRLAVDVIFCEMVLREQAGDGFRVGDYLACYPEHAAALRRQWEVHLACGEGLPPLR
jgi:hypothetical protein